MTINTQSVNDVLFGVVVKMQSQKKKKKTGLKDFYFFAYTIQIDSYVAKAIIIIFFFFSIN